MKRFLVTVMRNPGFDAGLIPAHAAFLEDLRKRECLEMAGPFADASGGAYLLLAEDMPAAEATAFADPLHKTRASTIHVREWNAR